MEPDSITYVVKIGPGSDFCDKCGRGPVDLEEDFGSISDADFQTFIDQNHEGIIDWLKNIRETYHDVGVAAGQNDGVVAGVMPLYEITQINKVLRMLYTDPDRLYRVVVNQHNILARTLMDEAIEQNDITVLWEEKV